ncbi:MAG: hypothetical protein K2O03_11700 [Lachnospiraceae bacterium]|nr:hypothetical protein [Lachnospiraceae bacterium]
MENNITLTNDEIHAIRVENSKKRRSMNSHEYRKLLDEEIAPALRKLEELKKAQMY